MENKSFWWKNAVFYEAYVDKFAGTFSGFAQAIDYLKELGINCIHILPHYPSPMIDDGYDVSDYKNIRKELGTLADFSRFVGRAHGAGIRVIVDFVLNHASVQHPWFIEASNSRLSDRRNFFLWSKTGKELSGAVNVFKNIKPSNWIYNPPTGDYYFSTFYPTQADLNWDNPELFTEMMRVIDFWVDLGVDGFRLDAVSHLVKREGTTSKGLRETHALLKKIRSFIDEHHPGTTILLAEVHDTMKKIKEYFGGGKECHMAYHFPLAEQFALALKRGDTSGIRKMIEQSRDIPDNCQWAVFLSHHDELSLKTLNAAERNELVDYFDPEKKYRFETGFCMRIANMFRGDRQKIIEAFRMLLNFPGSPVIYYGDELGMGNLEAVPGEKDTRKFLRCEFDWNLAEAEMRDRNSIFSAVAEIIRGR